LRRGTASHPCHNSSEKKGGRIWVGKE